jgi:uncharacterized protein (UPF0335 family)
VTLVWKQADGTLVSCREKLRVLEENQAELVQVMQDAFDDAVLIGVDETALRQRLHSLVDDLRSPKSAVRR